MPRKVTRVSIHLNPRPDAAVCAALAADFDAANFRSEPLRTAWGAEADDALVRGIRSPIVRALQGRTDALATLARLFVVGMPQPRDDVAAALPRTTLEGLRAVGLAAEDDDVVVPAALVRPQSFLDGDGVGEWWIASDLDEVALGGAIAADHVLGVGGASTTLAEVVVPTPVARALDVGTGCGIQALLLSRRAEYVVATDVSQRALAYAEINALLAGIRNIEFRHGSMFEPVAGESFDLVVSNPPFVITPRNDAVPTYEYRDGGLAGDRLIEQLVHEAPQFLTPGGVAQFLGNWESNTEHDGIDRLRSWVPDGTDAWVVEREQLTPLAYAEMWVRDGGITTLDTRFEQLLHAWLDDFAARNVSSIGFGYVLLRRPDAGDRAPLARYERVEQPLANPGRALENGLIAWDALADGLPERLVVAADVTEARHHMPGHDAPRVIELRQGGGFCRTVQVDPALAGIVGACDGELTVSQIVAAVAQLLEVDAHELWDEVEPQLRELFVNGFVVTAE
ncbi:DUF7059 domain-containing protein [Microbacterium sp. YY-01]|uniref:DUF7059 domain-containing protein n=1 Tax=Microbacterium sp. YY-01 TaxID=3421634 RepID=UPI003D16697A